MNRLPHHAESRMQPPTAMGIRIRSVQDAHIVFHSVMTGLLPMVTRRLDTEERRAVRSGNVYVWEERGRHTEATGVSTPSLSYLTVLLISLQLGIERWTDGIRWSASRVRDVRLRLFFDEAVLMTPICPSRNSSCTTSGIRAWTLTTGTWMASKWLTL